MTEVSRRRRTLGHRAAARHSPGAARSAPRRRHGWEYTPARPSAGQRRAPLTPTAPNAQAPLVLAIFDAFFHVVLVATRGRVSALDQRALTSAGQTALHIAAASLHAHPDALVSNARGFHFRTSATDVAALAVVRSVVAVVAWLVFSSRANLFRAYLLSSYLSALLAAALIAVKAPLYHYAQARGPQWLAPVLFSSTLVASLAHVALASQAAAASRRRRSHLELCSSADECWASPAPGQPAARPLTAHRRRQSREDVEASLREAGETDVPANEFADAGSHFAECEGVSVHYKSLPASGGATDTAILLLHAWGGGEHAWRNVAPMLARRCGCRLIAFDRAGFGLSGRPAREAFAPNDNPYTLGASARVAVALCRQLGVRRVVLVGHADGCTLALLVAALIRQQPDVACAGVALLAPTGGEVVPTGAKLLLRSSVGLPLLRPLLRSEVAEVSLRRAFHQPSKLTPAVLARYAEPLRVLGWDRALWEVARCAGELSRGELSALADGAAAAGTPGMVLTGAQDRIAPPEIAASMAASLGTDVHAIPDCGHLPQEESPAALVSLLAPAICAWLAPPPSEGSPRSNGALSSPERDGGSSPVSADAALVCCHV